jgi:ATP-dependent Zn protease
MDERTVTSYHESGHAVADYYYGFPIEYVSIVRGNGVSGMCKVGGGKLMPGEVPAIIVALLAGIQAVAHFFGQPDLQSKTDRVKAVEFAIKLNRGDISAAKKLMQRCWWTAQRIVEAESERIDRLALALLKHDQLSGKQVDAILSGHNRSSER